MPETLTLKTQTTEPILESALPEGHYRVVSDEYPDGVICTVMDDLYVTEHGEIVGLVEKSAEPFTVKDGDTLGWVLGKMQTVESEIYALRNNPEVIRAKAILVNAQKMEKKLTQKLNWLHCRFDPEIESFVRPNLSKNSKSYETLFGTISFRKKNGGLRVKDPKAALHFAQQFGLTHAIKTSESFQISGLTAEDKEKIQFELEALANCTPLDPVPITVYAFGIEPDTETMTITTGVGL